MRSVVGLISLAGYTVSGCALMVHGTNQTVSITSTPPGATAEIFQGTDRILFRRDQKLEKGTLVTSIVTPGSVELRRRNDYFVRLSHDGYATTDQTLCRNTAGSPWVMGNLLLLFAPILVDQLTGASNEFEDGYHYVLLREATPEEPLVCRPR